MGMKIMEGDKAFYYLHDGTELQGAVLTHIDNFTIAGKDEFLTSVVDTVEKRADNFKSIEVSMNDYADSIAKKKSSERLKGMMSFFLQR